MTWRAAPSRWLCLRAHREGHRAARFLNATVKAISDPACYPINKLARAQATRAWFARYSWPGNVRELEHLVYQGLLLSEGREIFLEPPAALAPAPPLSRIDSGYRIAKEQAIAEFELAYLTRLIDEARSNVSVAARMACTERRHLGRLLKKHRLLKTAAQV